MILAGTGHRFPYPFAENADYEPIFQRLVSYAESILPGYKPAKVISGMAVFWDQAIALAALKHGVPLVAALPFVGQEYVWPQAAKNRYHDILKQAAEVVVVCEGGYATHKYHERDKWMVTNSEAMLALWNGHKKGGTYSTIKYAEKVGRTVYNVWPGWEGIQLDLQ